MSSMKSQGATGTRKILVICGQTAAGKTSYAFELARLLGGDLVSADSRQVYRGMDIGTGKDIPEGFRFKRFQTSSCRKSFGYYTNGDTRLWGLDVADVSETFHVAEYVHIVEVVIREIWAMGRLPVIVGGSGMYISSLIDPPATLDIPIDASLRSELSGCTIGQLQTKLRGLDDRKYLSMSSSDRENPRRLIRAIEVVVFRSGNPVDVRTGDTSHPGHDRTHWDVYCVGMVIQDKEVLSARINQRVQERIAAGMDREVRSFRCTEGRWPPVFSVTPGYRQWTRYIDGQVSYEQAVTEWQREEQEYARRQMTWFRKQKGIHWLNAVSLEDRADMTTRITQWYTGKT